MEEAGAVDRAEARARAAVRVEAAAAEEVVRARAVVEAEVKEVVRAEAPAVGAAWGVEPETPGKRTGTAPAMRATEAARLIRRRAPASARSAERRYHTGGAFPA